MWNTLYANRIVNFHNKIKEQRLHLERLVTMKPVIDIAEPYKPSFLKTRLKKEQMEEEKQNVIDYENTLLHNKIVEAKIKPGYYNAEVLSPKRYPAFDKKKHTYAKAKKEFDIDVSNYRLKYRIAKIKGYYDNKELIRKSKQDDIYRSIVSKGKAMQTPYLTFDSPEEFKRKLDIQLRNELMSEQFRPKSAKVTAQSERKINSNSSNGKGNLTTTSVNGGGNQTKTVSTNPPTTF